LKWKKHGKRNIHPFSLFTLYLARYFLL
jgi:hypothetical protein